ncbi:MAG: DUF3558 domain-containing protein [Pseudonocardia sp.]
MIRTLGLSLVALGLFGGLTACGLLPRPTPEARSTGASADPLPPRPREIRMDDLDPCTLASSEVLKQARVPATPRTVPATAPGIKDCVWERSVLDRPSGSLGVTAATAQDVRNILWVSGAKVTTIGGFGAVQSPDLMAGERFSCELRIDVAPSQGLWVSYYNTLADEPGATHELMCQRARTAAEGIMRNLLASTR